MVKLFANIIARATGNRVRLDRRARNRIKIGLATVVVLATGRSCYMDDQSHRDRRMLHESLKVDHDRHDVSQRDRAELRHALETNRVTLEDIRRRLGTLEGSR